MNITNYNIIGATLTVTYTSGASFMAGLLLPFMSTSQSVTASGSGSYFSYSYIVGTYADAAYLSFKAIF